METSILNSVKDYVGISPDDLSFDEEILLHINTAFMTLRQINVGSETPFTVEDDTADWTDFTEDDKILPMVKSYITLKTRVMFDPPTSSALMTALNQTISEYEWRLNVESDDYKVEEDENYAG